MTLPENIGWFRYGRHPEGTVGKWTITRSPDDPPIVVWQVGDDTWIVDDDLGEQHLQVGGFTEAEIRASLAFAQVIGWIPLGTEAAFRQLPSTG